jgi:hypothetical protein
VLDGEEVRHRHRQTEAETGAEAVADRHRPVLQEAGRDLGGGDGLRQRRLSSRTRWYACGLELGSAATLPSR